MSEDWALIKAEEWLDKARESDGKEWSFDHGLLADEIATYLRTLVPKVTGGDIIAKINAFVDGADSISAHRQLITMFQLALLARDEILRLRRELAELKSAVA